MNYQISGLDGRQFDHLHGKDPDFLASQGVRRITVDSKPGFPCRVALRDAEPGEHVLLMNFEHQPAASPYRSSHAIFVIEGADSVHPAPNEVPEMFRHRLIAVRAFDSSGMMVAADISEGHELEEMFDRFFSDEAVAYLHLHNAKPGCFMARVERHAGAATPR